MLVRVKLKGAKLANADLTKAIICESDLTNADLGGAHLDGALIGGYSQLNGANLTNASAREISIADADGQIKIDGADLRGANITCIDLPRCLGNQVGFSSVGNADLRSATIASLCCASLDRAQLDGVTTEIFGNIIDTDLAQLAVGLSEVGRISSIPAYGDWGKQTDFSGRELRELAELVKWMQAASAHPSFDCSRADTELERAICGDAKLAALDAALGWLWNRIKHTPQQRAAQKKWLATRTKCPPPREDELLSPLSFGSSADPQGCIGRSYASRILELAPESPPVAISSGTYTTDPPLEIPQGPPTALARKYLLARGYRNDEIAVENLGKGTGKISGDGLWGNGHLCGFEASEADTQRAGVRFRINDDPRDPVEKYSVSFIVTPQVIVRAGGDKQFQCGARGGWSDVYFRQPDDLISSAKSGQKSN